MAWSFLCASGEHEGWVTKTRDHLCQEVSEVLAAGGAVQIYCHPQRSGHLAAWEHELFAEVAAFCRARQVVTQGTISLPQVAVLHSETHYFAHCDPLFAPGSATHPVEGAVHALLGCGYHVDVVNEETLVRRLEDYPLVVVAEQDPVGEALREALAAYVAQGGRLLLTGAHVARKYAALAGVAPAGLAVEAFRHVPVRGASVSVRGPWQAVTCTTAEEWAPLLSERDPFHNRAGCSAVTLNRVGDGAVAAVHGALFTTYFRARYPQIRWLLADLVHQLWPQPTVQVEAVGPLSLSLRQKDDDVIVHLCNRGAAPPPSPRSPVVERVPPFGPVTLRLRTARRPRTVRVVPEEEGVALAWQWEEDTVVATLSLLPIHVAVVAEAAGGIQ